MNSIVKMSLMALCIALCSARHLPDHREAVITKMQMDPWRPDGYKFAYETSLGSSRKEIGYLKTAPDGSQFLVTRGVFSYIGTDNLLHKVKYIADENGYHPLRIEDSDDLAAGQDDSSFFDEKIESEPTIRSGTEAPESGTPPTNTRIAESAQSDDEDGIGNRVGLPPGLIGSLLG